MCAYPEGELEWCHGAKARSTVHGEVAPRRLDLLLIFESDKVNASALNDRGLHLHHRVTN